MRGHITLVSSHETYILTTSLVGRQGAMALDSCYDCCVLPPPPPLGWDCDWTPSSYQAIHRGDDDDDDFFAAICVESPASSEASSGGAGGYLEDAVAHWSDRCKRQRMAPPPPSPVPRRPATVNEEDLQCLLQMQSLWDSVSGEGDLLHDSKMMVQETGSSFVSEEEEDDASGREQEQEEGPSAAGGQGSAAQGGGEVEAGPPPRLFPATGQLLQAAAPRPLQLQKATTGEPARRRSSSGSSSNYGEGELPSSSSLAGKENAGYGVLCPFQFVKPMGLEGGGTTALKDVNQRILKRPARPVRHPVGLFACSAAVSADGVGLSGKEVVSLTRIRTGGKGTITIIRTRG